MSKFTGYWKLVREAKAADENHDDVTVARLRQVIHEEYGINVTVSDLRKFQEVAR